MTPQEIFDNIQATFGDQIIDLNENVDPWIRIKPEAIADVCWYMRNNGDLDFESLMCLSGVDFEDHMTVVYHLGSSSHKHKIALKVEVGRDVPKVPTVERVWRIANWHERETYDMYGIVFEGHSDLRRILCPDDWEGYPLRKDYQVQEFYRGIKVEV
ncbi:MAG: NADH-quinone oxidoreductase subunit C [Candidatus Latescibacterota bacterium]|nr:NADH-quinone oxidoreductase subunit C [Candidatus Latescibacterota bacterium]